MRAGNVLAAVLLVGCGGADDPAHQPDRAVLEAPGPSEPPDSREPTIRPVPHPVPGPIPVWQPGFHQALRWSEELPRTTLRLKVPVGRSGEKLKLAFRTGDGSGSLHGATVARAGEGGALASAPMPLTFDGEEGFSAGARERVESDALPFAVAFGEELYVTIEVEGHFSANAIGLLPDSWAARGVPPDEPVVGAWKETRVIGLQSVLVLAPRTKAVLAIGDSITEAFIEGDDDYRDAWPSVAQDLLGSPVVSAAVSGQGLWGAREYFDGEIAVVPNVSDCVVLLGTNDLGADGVDEAWMRRMLAGLFDDLRPLCRVWAGTLLPKDRADIGPELRELRKAVNAWLRSEAEVDGVIDFEAALREPGDPDRFRPGLANDGVHPTALGQRLLGEEAARILGEAFERPPSER